MFRSQTKMTAMKKKKERERIIASSSMKEVGKID